MFCCQSPQRKLLFIFRLIETLICAIIFCIYYRGWLFQIKLGCYNETIIAYFHDFMNIRTIQNYWIRSCNDTAIPLFDDQNFGNGIQMHFNIMLSTFSLLIASTILHGIFQKKYHRKNGCKTELSNEQQKFLHKIDFFLTFVLIFLWLIAIFCFFPTAKLIKNATERKEIYELFETVDICAGMPHPICKFYSNNENVKFILNLIMVLSGILVMQLAINIIYYIYIYIMGRRHLNAIGNKNNEVNEPMMN